MANHDYKDGDRILIQRGNDVKEVTYKVYRTFYANTGYQIKDSKVEIIVNKAQPEKNNDVPATPTEPTTPSPEQPEDGDNTDNGGDDENASEWTLDRYKNAVRKKVDLIDELTQLEVPFISADPIGKLRDLLYDTLTERGLLPEGATRYES